MSNNLKELANMMQPFKPSIGITVGKVLSVDPYRIQYGDKIILESKHLRFTSALINGYTGDYTDDNGTSTATKQVTVKNNLQVGDQVILMPDNSNKIWFVIDRMVKL